MSKAVQKAFIEVNEEGAEAAAASGKSTLIINTKISRLIKLTFIVYTNMSRLTKLSILMYIYF